ncbi:MAG: 6-carboxytetrahydropterin synthase [Acidobacteriaceae bacterium]|nr:6-carboxytetrahydropterin synthase [Acidobacteriaceae bacterium]MBV9779131.1 6-carboxytetrahydropterin synthase [Acidobacteriaceae bacterium]
MKLTRRYHFSASHRLHSPELTKAENTRLYGKCNYPFGHGHDYVLEVTVGGDADSNTGLLLPIAKLDRLVREKVLQLIAHRNLNLDVPQFAHLIPTTENLALVIADLLEENWPAYLGQSPVRLHRIHIQETDRNGFELLLDSRPRTPARHRQTESVALNA